MKICDMSDDAVKTSVDQTPVTCWDSVRLCSRLGSNNPLRLFKSFPSPSFRNAVSVSKKCYPNWTSLPRRNRLADCLLSSITEFSIYTSVTKEDTAPGSLLLSWNVVLSGFLRKFARTRNIHHLDRSSPKKSNIKGKLVLSWFTPTLKTKLSSTNMKTKIIITVRAYTTQTALSQPMFVFVRFKAVKYRNRFSSSSSLLSAFRFIFWEDFRSSLLLY